MEKMANNYNSLDGSSGHAPFQGDLFDLSRWPRRPYCADDLEQGVCIRSLASAIKRPYIQANPPHLRVWAIFDVDRPGAAVLWRTMSSMNSHVTVVTFCRMLR